MRKKCKQCGANLRPVYVQCTVVKNGVRLPIVGRGVYRWDCPSGHMIALSEIAREVNKYTSAMYAQASVQRYVIREDFDTRGAGLETYLDSFYGTYLYAEPKVGTL